MTRGAVGNAHAGDEINVMAGIWTHDDVERRLREAMTTLRRIPMHANGMPSSAGATWPDYPYNTADRAGWIVGATTPEYLRRNEADQNRTRLHATRDQIRDLDECLNWLLLIADRRKRKVVFARSHVTGDFDRPMISWPRLARETHAGVTSLKRYYRAGIRDIAEGLTNGQN